MINQTLFTEPIRLADVPQGGAILEVVTWNATVPTGLTFPFTVFSGYGTGTTLDNFVEKFYGFGFHDVPLTGSLVEVLQTTNVGYIFAADAPTGTYDCLTIIGYVKDGLIQVIDWKIDAGVLTIEPGLAATIISTSFSSV